MNISYPKKLMQKLLFLIGSAILGGSLAKAQTPTNPDPVPTIHYVSQDSSNPVPPYASWETAAVNIQDAVAATSVPGSLIVVSNGVYEAGLPVNSSRVFLTNAVVVRSVNGPAVTTIAGSDTMRCVYLAPGAVLSGFTLTRGRQQFGGGVLSFSTGVVTNCVIQGNSAVYGGGIHGGSVYNCILKRNDAFYGGGAHSATLFNCALIHNQSQVDGGGALDGSLHHCTVTLNSAKRSGGGLWGNGAAGSSLQVYNSIVYFNSAAGQVSNHSNADFLYSCTTPLPSGEGNIEADPQLASASHLSGGSPCIGIGNAAYSSGVDIDGEAWIDPPSLGADQFVPGQGTGPLVVTIEVAGLNENLGLTNFFAGLIEGRVTSSVWDFGDGTLATNQPLVRHVWSRWGLHTVTLRAFNDTYPEGISASLQVAVKNPDSLVGLEDATSRWLDESEPAVSLVVTRSGNSLSAFTIDYTTMDATALAGEDYVAATGTLHFAEGELTKEFTIAILNDAWRETTEALSVYLSNPSGEWSLDPGRIGVTIIIEDNDSGVGFERDLRMVDESETSVTLTVVRGADDQEPFTVEFDTLDDTATGGEDYVTAAGTLEFAQGEQSKTLTIDLANDGLSEGEEQFTVWLFNPTGDRSLDPAGTGVTIVIGDNDPGIGFEQNRLTVDESETSVTLTVERGADDQEPFTVDFSTFNETATGGEDYIPSSGTLEFADGEESQTLAIELRNDSVREGNEQFTIHLFNPSGERSFYLARRVATVVIDDNDPGIGFSGTSMVVNENQGTVTLTVRRGGDLLQGSFSVDYDTEDGTAVAGEDYLAATGTLTFAHGEGTKTLDVVLLNDGRTESEERFNVRLSNPTDGQVLNPSYVVVAVRIRDNDSGVGFDPSYYTVPEDVGFVDIKVVRQTDYAGPFVINYETLDTGQAIPGVDFVETAGVLEFADGEMFRMIEVEILNDAQTENAKDFRILLSNLNVPFVNIYTSSSTVRILDNDQGISLEVAETHVSEREASVLFTVHRGADHVEPFTVDYMTQDLWLSGRPGYQPVSSTISFGQGVTTQAVEILLAGDDTRWEGDDEFEVVLSNPTGVGFLDANRSSASVIVVDDEPFEWEVNWVGEPFPGGRRLTALTWGNGLYVALGWDSVLVSEDTSAWSTQQVPGLQASDVIWAEGAFVAVGSTGLWRSLDGLTWTNLTAAPLENPWRIRHGDGIYVVLEQMGRVWSTTNLNDWTETDLGSPLRGIAHGDAGFVVTGEEGRAWYGRPEQAWDPLGRITTGDLGPVAWGDQGYVTLANGYDETAQLEYVDLLHSVDGRTWQTTRLDTEGYYSATQMLFAEGAYLTAGSWNEILRLRRVANEWVIDGRSSTQGGWGFTTGPQMLAYGSSGYFGISQSGCRGWWSTGWRSQDALNWERLERRGLDDVHVTGNHVFIKHIGPSCLHSPIPFELLSSEDLTAWTVEVSSSTYYWPSLSMASLGDVMGYLLDQDLHLRTPDGTWTPITFTNAWIQDFTTSPDQWVVVGEVENRPAVFRSADALTWELALLEGSGSFSRVTHAGEWYFASGWETDVGNVLRISPDAIEWRESALSGDYDLYSVAYGNGIYVALAHQINQDQDVFLRSLDGVNWEVTSVWEPNSFYSTDLEYGGGLFAARNIGGRFFLSRDGVEWKRHSPYTDISPNAMDYADGRFVAVGYDGLLLRSPSLVHLGEPRWNESGEFTVTVEGEAGRAYAILGSADVEGWTVLGTVVLTQSVQRVTLPAMSPSANHGFYRLTNGAEMK